MQFEFACDRGGTFTDLFCSITHKTDPSQCKSFTYKILSESCHYKNSICEGIRRCINDNIPTAMTSSKIDSSYIKSIKIGTTIATNALLERKGARTALLITKGFKDLLLIGNQSRTQIFDLEIKRPETLYEKVIEVDERVRIFSKMDPDFTENGPDYEVLKPLDETYIREVITQLKNDGIESLAISLMHSYKFKSHELTIQKIAKELGYKYAVTSHQVSGKIGYLSRTSTTVLDAYLNPILSNYIEKIIGEFDSGISTVPIYFMQSDGTLVLSDNFRGCKAI